MYVDTRTGRELRKRLMALRETVQLHKEGALPPDSKFSPRLGICTSIGYAGDPCRRAFSTLSQAWGMHSGDDEYPVPAPDGVESPMYVYHSTNDMWVGVYGDLRMRLLDFVITQLEGY